MTRDETIALFLECEARRAEARAAALAEGKDEDGANATAHEAAKAHWNAWAEARLAERKAMEADGRWAAEKDTYGTLEPKNPETRAWMEKAEANFSRGLFLVRGVEGPKETAGEEKENKDGEPPVKSIQLEGDSADFSGFIFPGLARFNSATFSSLARFESAAFADVAWFVSATFSGLARFESATFSGVTVFSSATFSGDAGFESATFSGVTVFSSATFSGDAGFVSAAFSGDAGFVSAAFSGVAGFESAAFSGVAGFQSATFSGNALFYKATFSGDALFESATFRNFTSFWKAKFLKGASFGGIKLERAFEMTGAKFAKAPSFNQADFKQSPDLDAVDFPLPGFWRRGDADLIPRYRALRRMAIQSADYEREQMAFKGETRSKRWTEHKPWHTAFWFGIAYDALSDYGRSIARPLGIWLASAIAFAAIYAWNAGVAVSGWASACADDEASKALKALTLSAANSLPLIGSSRGEVAREFYTECLKLEHAPAWSPILQIWQTLWSAVLLFLFLLALRNQFKIK